MNRVLVVDDDPLIMAAAAELFRQGGHSVVRARSYEEAVAALEADARIRLVVTDICLGNGQDGLALAAAAAELRPAARIVIFSGRVKPPVEQCPPRSVFFEKPYNPDLLLAAAEAALC